MIIDDFFKFPVCEKFKTEKKINYLEYETKHENIISPRIIGNFRELLWKVILSYW